jgi:MYXO-CTERM domain-containing protein
MRAHCVVRTAATGLATVLIGSLAHAAPVIAPPGDPSFNAPLSNMAAGYQLQQDTFAALEFGLSLDVDMADSAVPSVQAFFAQDATTNYQTFSGMKPFAAVAAFNEYEDIGNFAGIASVGVAARLLALEAQGAPADSIAIARAAAVRAAQAWHIYATIGGPGVIARGIQRTTPLDASTGPLPSTLPPLVPLKDGAGNPLPNPKAPVWRAPVASGYDGWIWLDDTSKDQVSGYSLAAAWLWDALAFDPLVDPSVTEALADDLTVFAKALMKPAPEYDDIDLCIRDADGRLTTNHDLNPRQIVPTSVVSATFPVQNGFNAAMALGVILAAYHTGGDPVVGQYLYDELIVKRGYPGLMSDAGVIFAGPSTNYSNVNMLAISFGLLGRFEADPKLRAGYAASVESTFWSVEASYDALSVQQAWFDVVYGGISAHPTSAIRQRVANNLGGFPQPPAFNVDRINCSPSDIKAGSCIGIDGMTKITLVPGECGHDGTVVATLPLPMSIRPYSDFLWRSDPHDVNGTGTPNLLDPGGDFLAAYWLGRVIDLDDLSKNVTPHPRAPYVSSDGGADAGPMDAGKDASSSKSTPSPTGGGCSCDSAGDATGALGIGGFSVLGLLLAFAARRRPA